MQLLDAVLQAARDDGFARVELSAQTHAIEFYAGRGFVAEGPEYLDAGIAHRSMSLALQDIS
jgi:predicted GNAT family N-acyltransferase